MPSGTFKLRYTNKVDEWGKPRQTTIRNLEVGEQVKGRPEFKNYDDDDEMPILVIETKDGIDIGEIEPLDADYFVRRADAGDIVLFFIDELKENKRTSNLDVYVRIESYLPKDARKKYPGVFDDYNEFTKKRPPIKTKLRGVIYENSDGLKRQDIIKAYVKIGDQLLIAHDYENQKDPKAIGAYTMLEGYLVGYLSKDLSASILPAIKNHQLVECEVLDISGIGDPDKSLGVNIQLNVLTKQETIDLAKRNASEYKMTHHEDIAKQEQILTGEIDKDDPSEKEAESLATLQPTSQPPRPVIQENQPVHTTAQPTSLPTVNPPTQAASLPSVEVPTQPAAPQPPTWNTYTPQQQYPPKQQYQPQPQYQAKPNLIQRWRLLPKYGQIGLIILLVFLSLCLLSMLVSCAPQTIEVIITKEVEVTREVEVIQTLIVTATPIPPTETPIPTNTPEPTIKPPTPTAATNPETIAKNVHQVQEQNGVEVVLERILITDPNSEIGQDLRDDEYYKNKSVYVQPVIKIINNTDRIIKIFFAGDIIVMANDEQVSFGNFLNIFYPPEYAKDIMPGATIRGPVWVGL